MSGPRKEYGFLNLARILACIAVVAIHSVNVNADWWLGRIATSFSIWAVPLFVMISGALLLDPQRKESAQEFYTRRFWKIGIPTLIWIPFYFIFDHFYRGDSLSLQNLTYRILHSNFDHLYFLILIIELYALTPLLRILIKHLDRKYILGISLLFFFIAIFWPPSSFTGTMFVPYIGYYIFGSYALSLKIPKNYIPFLQILFVVAGSLIALFEMYSHAHPLVIVLTASIFFLLQQINIANKKIKDLSSTTFGIYILHPFILYSTVYFLRKFFLGNISIPWYLILLLFMYTCIFSFFVVKILKRYETKYIL